MRLSALALALALGAGRAAPTEGGVEASQLRRDALVREVTNGSHARLACQPMLQSLAARGGPPARGAIVLVTGFTDRGAAPKARRDANVVAVDLALNKALYAHRVGNG